MIVTAPAPTGPALLEQLLSDLLEEYEDPALVEMVEHFGIVAIAKLMFCPAKEPTHYGTGAVN